MSVRVLNHVLSKIVPSSEEQLRLDKVVFKARSRLNQSLVQFGVHAELVVGGSYARGTWLSGSHDVDLFVRFSDKSDMKVFPEAVKKSFPKARLVHGSRDYFKTIIDGFELEFIPTLLIKDPSLAENSMDASFFHIEYVNARLNDHLRDQARLLKQFFKAQGVYGAESHVSGFSGYVTELLIVRFGGFTRVLEFFSQGNELFIDLEGYYDSPARAQRVIGSAPVMVIDPVLASRNAAAAVSQDSIDQLVLAARLFLDSPSNHFFQVIEPSINDLRLLAEKRGHHFLSHQFKIEGKSDVFFAKLLKHLKRVKRELEINDFMVFDFGFLSNGVAYFELVNNVLPFAKRVLGPPVSVPEEHFKSFIDKYDDAIFGPYVFQGRVCFDVKREYTRVKSLFSKLIITL